MAQEVEAEPKVEIAKGWNISTSRNGRTERPRNLVVLEDLVYPTLSARVIMVKAIPADQFS